MIAPEQHLYQTIVQFHKTIVLLSKLATGSIHDYIFFTAPLVGILCEVLRIVIFTLSLPLQQQYVVSLITFVVISKGFIKPGLEMPKNIE